MNSANEWRTVKLEDICAIEVGKTPARKNPLYWGPGHPWLSIRDMNQGAEIYSTRETITDAAVDEANMKLRPAGSVLFSFKLSIGKVAIAKIPLFTNEAIAALTPIDEGIIDRSYLAHFLRAVGPGLQGNRAVMGTTLNKRSLGEIDIPLPPLAEQQRIADILDTSAEIIQEEERLQHSILPLAINVVERKITSSDGTLGNLIKSMSSGKNVAESPDPNQKNWVLKVSAVTSGTFKPEESKPLPDTYLPPQSHQVRRGDILVSRANTAQLLGASALVENDVESLYLPDKIWRVTPKDRVDPYLLWGILQTKTVRARISQRATGSSGSMKNISQKNFLQVPCATFSESESAKLAALIREAVSVHHQIAHKLSLLRSLHNSLSTRAFVGQL